MTSFEHYAPEIRALDKRIYPQKDCMKPKGLWFSPADTDDEEDRKWSQFCEGEQFMLERLRYRHTFNLDMSKILVIDTHEGIDKLALDYKGTFGETFDRSLTNYAIDWRKLETLYSGILIALTSGRSA
jgi:hypothetical protein